MDPSGFKDLTVSRGLVYHYYSSPPRTADGLTLLLIHGFPNTSLDWRFQVAAFQDAGHGVIVPDMLGFGGTSKPVETEAYSYVLICRDVIDILDAENAERVLSIGHDWGSAVSSRLANFYPERFLGFAFISAGYVPPRTENNMDQLAAQTKALLGYEIIGYWYFMHEEDAPQIIAQHLDSFMNALFCKDPMHWARDVAGMGKLKAWVVKDKHAEPGEYLPTEDMERMKQGFRKDGWAAPVNWYRMYTKGLDVEDTKAIPPDNFTVKKPVFFGSSEKDYICISTFNEQATKANCTDVEVHHFDAAHWVLYEKKDELSQILLEWVKRIATISVQ